MKLKRGEFSQSTKDHAWVLFEKLALFSIILFFVSCTKTNSSVHNINGQEITSPALRLNDISLVLMVDTSREFIINIPPAKKPKQKLYIDMIIWNDGHILYCSSTSAEEPQYFYGKHDKNYLFSFVERIRDDFRLRDIDIEVYDFSVDHHYRSLLLNNNKNVYAIHTREFYENISFEEDEVILNDKATLDKKPIRLVEFYEIWRRTKNNIISLGESVASKDDTTEVSLVYEDNTFFIYDMSGQLIKTLELFEE